MTVPAWSRIFDSEIDPESPLTSSLITRLRDNVLAILNIDPADPAPVFTIPPSVLKIAQSGLLTAHLTSSATSDTMTTSEVIISTIAEDVEVLKIAYCRLLVASPTITDPVVEFGDIDVVYSSGAPTGVRIQNTSGTMITLPLTNTFTPVYTRNFSGEGDTQLSLKTRADSTHVYLQARVETGTPYAYGMTSNFDMLFTLSNFKSKAAP